MAITPYVAEKVRHDDDGNVLMSYGQEPHGYTLRLGQAFKYIGGEETTSIPAGDRRKYVMSPSSILYCVCKETVHLSDNAVGTLVPKSTYTREGLFFSTALVDCCYSGKLWFTVFNASSKYQYLFKDEGIVNLLLHDAELPSKPYIGNYGTKVVDVETLRG